jgi:hypothetical protein
MKRKLLTLCLAVGVSALTGCAALSKPKAPATTIGFNPKTGQLAISDPKQLHIDGAAVTYNTNGQYTLALTNLSSTNDPAIVAAIAQAQAQLAKSFYDNMTSLNSLLTTAVTKAP